MSIYGCHNKPRPTEGALIDVQDGHHTRIFDYADGTADRIDRIVQVPYAMSTACQYTNHHAADPLCSGCVHRAKDSA